MEFIGELLTFIEEALSLVIKVGLILALASLVGLMLWLLCVTVPMGFAYIGRTFYLLIVVLFECVRYPVTERCKAQRSDLLESAKESASFLLFMLPCFVFFLWIFVYALVNVWRDLWHLY